MCCEAYGPPPLPEELPSAPLPAVVNAYEKMRAIFEGVTPPPWSLMRMDRNEVLVKESEYNRVGAMVMTTGGSDDDDDGPWRLL